MDLSLNGKVAMVAGASKGLGFSVASALAQEGALVSIVSRDSAAITVAAHRIEEFGAGTAFGFTADVRSAQEIAQWHRATGVCYILLRLSDLKLTACLNPKFA